MGDDRVLSQEKNGGDWIPPRKKDYEHMQSTDKNRKELTTPRKKDYEQMQSTDMNRKEWITPTKKDYEQMQSTDKNSKERITTRKKDDERIPSANKKGRDQIPSRRTQVDNRKPSKKRMQSSARSKVLSVTPCFQKIFTRMLLFLAWSLLVCALSTISLTPAPDLICYEKTPSNPTGCLPYASVTATTGKCDQRKYKSRSNNLVQRPNWRESTTRHVWNLQKLGAPHPLWQIILSINLLRESSSVRGRCSCSTAHPCQSLLYTKRKRTRQKNDKATISPI